MASIPALVLLLGVPPETLPPGCDLVSLEHVRAVVRDDVQAGKPVPVEWPATVECQWRFPRGEFGAQVYAYEADEVEAGSWGATLAEDKNFAPLEGVGDAAFWGGGTLHVRVGNFWIRASTAHRTKEAAVKLVEPVVKRIRAVLASRPPELEP